MILSLEGSDGVKIPPVIENFIGELKFGHSPVACDDLVGVSDKNTTDNFEFFIFS